MDIRNGSMGWRIIYLLLIGVLHVLGSRGPLDLSLSKEIKSQEREDFVLLLWGYDKEVQEIVMEIHTPLASSIALGLGPDLSLNKTDFVVAGWKEHNETYFYDAHAEGDWPPVKDKSQDYVLHSLSRNNTHSIMRVWRQWFTCDHHDQEIENDTLRVTVIISDGEQLELKEDHTFRRSIFFLEIVYHMVFPESTLSHDFRMNDYVIPDQDTTYACTFLPVPRLSKKHHIISYEPIHDPDTIGIVHHILIYLCANTTNATSEVGDCYGGDPRFYQCMTSMLGWAVGVEQYDYPLSCGASLGAEGDPFYVRIEIHYSNFENKEGLKDSSGIRIFYTPEVRAHDCSMLVTGIFTFPVHFIPPGSEAFRSYGLCNTEMLAEVLDEPIPDLIVEAVLLHGHLSVRGMRVMHYRNGTSIGSLVEDNTFDFNLQQIRKLPRQVTIKPGDQIVVECTSNTMDRDDVTFGGPSTKSEMCVGVLYYYPALPVSYCFSFVDITYIADALEMEESDSVMDAVLNLDSVDWNDETKAIAQEAVMKANQFIMVLSLALKKVNKTSPLPPISLPPPYRCEDNSLE